MKDHKPLGTLGRATGQLEILLYLYRNGPTPVSRFGRELEPTMDTLNRTLEVLAAECLVRYSKSSAFPFSKKYELTELGRRLVSAPMTEWETLLEFGPNFYLGAPDSLKNRPVRRSEIRMRHHR